MATLSGPLLFALIIQLVILVVVIYRQYLIYRGTPVSGARIAAGVGLLLFLFALLELEGYLAVSGEFGGLGLAILANAAIVVVAAIWAAGYAHRRARVWKEASGVWMYQLGLAPALLYVVFYFTRLGLEAAFLPSLLTYGSGAELSGLSVLQLLVLELVTVFLAMSTGVLIGRGLGVYSKYQKLVRAEAGPSGPGGTATAGSPTR